MIAKAPAPIAELVPGTRSEVTFGGMAAKVPIDAAAFEAADAEIAAMWEHLILRHPRGALGRRAVPELARDDPFDRLLLAQALVERCRLLTADARALPREGLDPARRTGHRA